MIITAKYRFHSPDYYGVKPNRSTQLREISQKHLFATLLSNIISVFRPHRKNAHAYDLFRYKGVFSEIGATIHRRFILRLKNGAENRRAHISFTCPVITWFFGYRPIKATGRLLLKQHSGATLFAPAISRSFALKYQDGAYVPDLEAMIHELSKAQQFPFPPLIMGFPSYTYFVLQMMDERDPSEAEKGSKIMLGGGWKQFIPSGLIKTFYELAYRVPEMGMKISWNFSVRQASISLL